MGQLSKYLLGHDTVLGFVPEFYLGYESNIPTYFSSMLWLFAAFLSGMIACAERTKRTSESRYWLGVAVVSLYLSLDEAGSLHERVIDRVPYQIWLVPTLIFMLAFLVIYAGFVWKLPTNVRKLMVIGAIVFSAGAFAVELVGVLCFHRQAGDGLGEAMYSTLLESLEIAGALLITYSLHTYLTLRHPIIELRFGNERSP
jgi:hypothetical protein